MEILDWIFTHTGWIYINVSLSQFIENVYSTVALEVSKSQDSGAMWGDIALPTTNTESYRIKMLTNMDSCPQAVLVEMSKVGLWYENVLITTGKILTL